jgi:hypothetical protein
MDAYPPWWRQQFPDSMSQRRSLQTGGRSFLGPFGPLFANRWGPPHSHDSWSPPSAMDSQKGSIASWGWHSKPGMAALIGPATSRGDAGPSGSSQRQQRPLQAGVARWDPTAFGIDSDIRHSVHTATAASQDKVGYMQAAIQSAYYATTGFNVYMRRGYYGQPLAPVYSWSYPVVSRHSKFVTLWVGNGGQCGLPSASHWNSPSGSCSSP